MKEGCEKPCKNCPFQKGMEWAAGYGARGTAAKIAALEELEEQKIFSCHMKHPDNNIFSFQRMKENDCVGYKMMLENMNAPDKHPEIVNCFNDTKPDYDLEYWAKHTPTFQNKLQLLKS